MPVLGESYWSADSSVALSEHTVGSLLADRACTHGDTVALVGTAHGTTKLRRLTYSALYNEARRVASALTKLTEPGDFVAIWAPNVVEWPIVQYGAALAGRTLVAINPVFRADELRYALTHSGATVLLHADRNRDYDMAAVVGEVAPEVTSLQHVISLSDEDRWRDDSGSEFVSSATDPEAPAMLQYTSGTTGLPKGVLLRHRSLVNVAKMTMEAADIEEGSVCVNPLPMFHTASCVIGTLGPLSVTGTALLVENFAPQTVLDWAIEEKASVLFFVPTILGALLETMRNNDRPAPQFRSILGGAANVPAVMIEGARRVFGGAVHNLFGQTELAPVLTLIRRSDSIDDQLGTVGRPIGQVEVKIVETDSGATAALGTQGEICARGYQQMIEYYKDPDATARTVDSDGWLHLGDLGSMDERGYVALTGRLKDLIISGGENVAPAEVESRLVEHASVAQAAVVGVPHEKWGETVAAVLVVRGERHPAELIESVRRQLGQRLAPFKMPKRWFVTDALPLTASGKVQKFVLREAIESERLEEVGRTA
jgi:fatty-acyl-CoA synthase